MTIINGNLGKNQGSGPEVRTNGHSNYGGTNAHGYGSQLGRSNTTTNPTVDYANQNSQFRYPPKPHADEKLYAVHTNTDSESDDGYEKENDQTLVMNTLKNPKKRGIAGKSPGLNVGPKLRSVSMFTKNQTVDTVE